jgi:hypothetical protein
MTGDLLAMRDWLIGQGITVVGMKATGAYWKPVFYLLESQMTCWMLNLIKVQQACVAIDVACGHPRPGRHLHLATRRRWRRLSLEPGMPRLRQVCHLRRDLRIGGTNASKWRQQLGRRRHRRLRVPAL